jgi:predicted MFS family arabinose efflux permease
MALEYTRSPSIFGNMTVDIERVPAQGLRKRLPGLLSLALASCLAVTTEMLPVGLLPVIGGTFGVSDSVTGLLVSLYAVMVAALAVPLTIATSRLARKPLLLATLLGYALTNALVAVAPAFGVVAAGRAVGGVTHALFFSLVIGYAPRLVSRADVGRALAFVGGGASTGLILGVPLFTSLGTAVGWRASFAGLAALSIMTFVLAIRLLPKVDHEQLQRVSEGAGRGGLAAVAASNTLAFLGQFTVFTYISLLLLGSGVSAAFVGPILLGCGACGLLGLWYAGRNLDRNPRRTSIVTLAVVIGAVVALGSAWPALVAVIIAAAVWNGAFGGVPSIYQACAVRTHAVSPELAGAWVNATANVGIAGGAAIGAGLLQAVGLSALPWAGACLLSLSLGVILMSRKAFPSATYRL